jgi:hypothetical protein
LNFTAKLIVVYGKLVSTTMLQLDVTGGILFPLLSALPFSSAVRVAISDEMLDAMFVIFFDPTENTWALL